MVILILLKMICHPAGRGMIEVIKNVQNQKSALWLKKMISSMRFLPYKNHTLLLCMT